MKEQKYKQTDFRYLCTIEHKWAQQEVQIGQEDKKREKVKKKGQTATKFRRKVVKNY